MAKTMSAQEKLNAFWGEMDRVRDTLKQFETAVERDGVYQYAFAAGFYQSLIVDLVMELPKAKRAAFVDRMQREAVRFAVK